MVTGLCAGDGREVDKPSLWWGGRKVEEPGAVSQAPWDGERICLASLGADAGHLYPHTGQHQPEG